MQTFFFSFWPSPLPPSVCKCVNRSVNYKKLDRPDIANLSFSPILLQTWLNHPCVLFNPVVENCGSSAGHEPFLCRHPIYDFKQESFVPAIVGLNSAEGGLFIACKSRDGHECTIFHLNFSRSKCFKSDISHSPKYFNETLIFRSNIRLLVLLHVFIRSVEHV